MMRTVYAVLYVDPLNMEPTEELHSLYDNRAAAVASMRELAAGECNERLHVIVAVGASAVAHTPGSAFGRRYTDAILSADFPERGQRYVSATTTIHAREERA